jgi:uncharacterized protein YaaW (UPF0174 family)
MYYIRATDEFKELLSKMLNNAMDKMDKEETNE